MKKLATIQVVVSMNRQIENLFRPKVIFNRNGLVSIKDGFFDMVSPVKLGPLTLALSPKCVQVGLT